MSACQPFREALSARADGEVAPVGHDALAAHLEACPTCTAFAAATDDLDRRLRVAPADAVPDLTAEVLAAVVTPRVDRARTRFGQLRALLAVAGLVQLALALPVLLAAGPGHVSREVGIFELALAVGFLLAAWRPARAGGLLPVAGVVAGLATVVAVGDVVVGTTSLVHETAHLVELVGTGLLWALHHHADPLALRPTTA